PGEAIFIDLEGNIHSRQCADNPTLNPCMFEYVYLARPDSIMDGVSVYQARLNLGETLAQRLISTMPPSEIDVVIPIPESSRPSAMQLAQKSGKPYREGFANNRYVGRTLTLPGRWRRADLPGRCGDEAGGGAVEPRPRRLRGIVLRRPLHHRRCDGRRLRHHRRTTQIARRRGRWPGSIAARLARRHGAGLMNDKKI